MKKGDLIKFNGSWAEAADLPRVGIVMNVMFNGRTKKPVSANIFWENGTTGNLLVKHLEVINESR